MISNSSQFGFSIDNDQLIKFISSHFYSIDPQKLQGLPFPILYTILSDKELKLLSEDSLFDFINQLFQSREKVDDSEKYLFYELVEFCSLSESKFNDLVEKIEEEKMTRSLWNKLKKCFFTSRSVVAKAKAEEERKSLNLGRYAVTDSRRYTTVEYENN
ncbi:hypothetical protein M9Y10_010870 [Tritrichomonas musculus]|uniref:Uncharacterized protein n=1 Tax=Tritrichomonas musculus TaxID=1915356 RepID=A0ABR2INH9_9EUKA